MEAIASLTRASGRPAAVTIVAHARSFVIGVDTRARTHPLAAPAYTSTIQ
jgi:hypothetical protein